MADFDPYRQWLGIPPAEQPPHHYRLLGVGLFESDANVVSNAADRQMVHVRQYQSGQYCELSQRLLNELTAARLCLLDPARKAAYDASLRQTLAVPARVVATSPSIPLPPPPPGAPAGLASTGPPPPPASTVVPPPPPAVASMPGMRAAPATRQRQTSLVGPALLLIGLMVIIGIVAAIAMSPADDLKTAATTAPPSSNDGGDLPASPPPARIADPPLQTPQTTSPDAAAVDPPSAGRRRANRRRGATSLPNRVGPLANLEGHRGPATSASWAPDGDFVLSGGDDGTVRLWDVQANVELRQFEGNINPIFAVDFSDDGQLVLAAGGKVDPPGAGLLLLWNAAGGQPARAPLSTRGVVAWDARFSPDGQQVALACHDHRVRLLDTATKTEQRSLEGHTAPVRCVAFCAQSGRLASGSDDHSVRVWSFVDDHSTAIQGHQGAVLAVAFSPDGKYLATAGADQTARLWTVESGQIVHTWQHPATVGSIGFAANGQGVVTGCLDGTIRLWRVLDGAEAHQFAAHEGGVRSVAFLPGSSRHLASAGNDGTVRIWGFPDLSPPDLAAAVAATTTVERLAVPSDEAQQKAERLITGEVFKELFANAERPAAKVALAERLIDEAGKPQTDPATPFVLYRLARDLAVETGEVETAMTAIDRLHDRYTIDAPSIRSAALETLAAGQLPTARRRTLTSKALAAIDEAVAADKFDVAMQLVRLSRESATKAHDGHAAREADARQAQVASLQEQYAALAPALATLAAKPADPSANLAVGEYECFVKGDWQKGLPRLAASSDEALQKLAKLDLSNPTAAAERLAIGNGWWDLAEARQQHRDALRQRAAHWYRPIESALVGIDQANVRKRLAQLDGTAEPASPASTSRNPDAAGRQVLLRDQGGNEASEAAVEKALDWLARHQNPDGSWSFNHVRPACKEQCPDAGTLDAPHGATSLALLPFLGAGHSHRADSRSKHRPTVSAALNYLRMNLARVGGLFDNDQGMPSHAWGAIALCEASEGGRDKSSRAAALAAIELIVNTQNADGGWSMLPRPGAQPNPSELATTAWNVVALKTAQAAGIVDPSRSLKRATIYLDGAAAPNGFRRSTDATGIDPLSTALGMQARIQLGWPREQPALTAYVAELSKAGPATNGRFYLSFLQSQTMREAGGASWPGWNTALRDHLINTQQTTGHAAGSWSSPHAEARQGGRLYCTALGALILEVYYRTAPVYP